MIIKKISDFNLEHTFDCGQCFRWIRQENGSYTGVAVGRVINIWDKDGKIYFDTTEDEFHEYWEDYLDLKKDYSSIKAELSQDTILKKAISVGGGIRILRQEAWETVVSFIISANNNIPRIKKIIEKLCELFGEEIKYQGKVYYSFPQAEVIANLTVDDLSPIKSGYRAKYILDAAKKVAGGKVDFDRIYKMNAFEGRAELKKICGIGDKVADCVLLFAFQKYSVFPKDVWIKRILTNLYNANENEFDDFAMSKFGNMSGYAQQYLFYYGRDDF